MSSGTSPSRGGSIVATFMQGVMLGGYVQGIKVQDGKFAGGTLRLARAVPAVHRGWRLSRAMRCSAPPGWS